MLQQYLAHGLAQATLPGVKIRHLVSGDRLQIAFTWEGQKCRELLPACAINKSSIQRAASLRDEIRRKRRRLLLCRLLPEQPKSRIAVTKEPAHGNAAAKAAGHL
ncbi:MULTISPECIES: Arm DNA-binding domain-containing protein [Comamonas]|uniref:Arm DNA-binding domain-containing protein n=1 Tax=Comamonas TaxID=283 RepID=UPI001F3C5988|nr:MULTISPECIES: DUF3596 domain-containing protein [Comamonas]